MSNRINKLHGRLRSLRTFPKEYPWTFGAILAVVIGLTVWGILVPYHGVLILGTVGILGFVGLVIVTLNKIFEEWY